MVIKIPKEKAFKAVLKIYLSKKRSIFSSTRLRRSFTNETRQIKVIVTLIIRKKILLSNEKLSMNFVPDLTAILIGLFVCKTSTSFIFPKINIKARA